jgi:hypothetical protein
LLEPAFAVAVVSSGYWISTTQPDTLYTSGDQVIVQWYKWIDKF